MDGGFLVILVSIMFPIDICLCILCKLRGSTGTYIQTLSQGEACLIDAVARHIILHKQGKQYLLIKVLK